MDQISAYVMLLGIIVIVGVAFTKTSIPTSLPLVVVGMFFSFVPNFPRFNLSPDLVLDVFLPVLIYQASAFTSWRDMKKNIRPIALLSIGHVLFITVLVAITIHYFVPELSWPLAFVLGAVVSPPDDVALISIAEKVHMPQRIVTILMGEGMLNDATALILFRFSLAAVVTHQFSAVAAVGDFFLVVVGETLYGLALGVLMGELRLRFRDPVLQMTASLVTPFLAYLPATALGGCGVLATVVTGFVIGHFYLARFSPEVRLAGRSIWVALGFVLQNILFLLVGLDFRYIYARISFLSLDTLSFYGALVVLVVIIGRFIWVYPATYLPRLLFPAIRKKDPLPPWQYPFVISWSGMRGGISLAAALAIPSLPLLSDGTNPRDLIIFLVFCVIIVTLVFQGLALPWVLKLLGMPKYGLRERYDEHLQELKARVKINRAVLHWLSEFKRTSKEDSKLCDEIKFRELEYKTIRKLLKERIDNHGEISDHDEEAEMADAYYITKQLIEVEREELTRLWRENKISHPVRLKLLQQLDHRSRRLT